MPEDYYSDGYGIGYETPLSYIDQMYAFPTMTAEEAPLSYIEQVYDLPAATADEGALSTTTLAAIPAAAPTPSYPAMPADYAQRAEDNARRAYAQAAQASFGARGELSKYLDDIDTSTAFNYSPEAAKYLYDVGRYPTENTEYNLSPINLMKVDPQTKAPLPYTSSQLEQYAQQPLENQFYANFNQSKPGGWDVGTLQFAPDQQYRLIDRKTGDVLYSGTGYEAGKNISDLATGLFDKSGQKADWVVQQAAPGSDQWTQRYEHVPDVNGFTTWLKMVAPMLGGALAAPLGLTGNLGAAAGSALGSAGAGVAAGDSLGDILKSAALSGVSSYAAGELLGKLGGGKAPSSGLGSIEADLVSMGLSPASAANIAGNITGALPTDIVVTGSNIKPGALSGFAGTLANAPKTTLTTGPEPRRPDYGDKVEEQPQTTDEIVVVGSGKPGTGGTGAISGLGAAIANAAATSAQQPSQDQTQQNAEDEIVVEGTGKPGTGGTGAVSGLAGAIADAAAASKAAAEAEKKGGLDTMDKIKLGLLGAGLVSDLFGGGGGSGGAATLPFGMGARNPTYSAKLPTPGVNGAFAVGGLGGGTMPMTGDLTQFGMGNIPRAAPTQVPQYGGVNPPGFNTQTWDWLGPQNTAAKDIMDQLAVLPTSVAPVEPVKKAMGGYAVGGPGDGRSDEIPALLSDGEYVIDAETVALLGNGSNKAGAQQLDKFRANIRKHKGRELARGKFSAKAKQPDAYLSGGR